MKIHQKKIIYALIFILLLFGLLIRLYLITTTDAAGDEIWALRLLQNGFKDIWTGSISDSPPPFYFLLLHAIAFVLHFQWTLWLYRTVSLLFGFLAILTTSYLAYIVSDRKSALIVYILCLFLPASIWMAVFARYYAFLVILTSLVLIFFIRFLQNKGKFEYIMLFIGSIIGGYTHYYFYLLIFSIGVYLYLSGKLKEYSKQFFIFYILVGVFSIPLVISFFALPHNIVYTVNNSILKFPAVIVSNISSFQGMYYAYYNDNLILIGLLLITVFITTLILMLKVNKKFDKDYGLLFYSVLLIPLVITIVISYSIRPIFAVNSFVIFFPVEVILIAKGMESDLSGNRIVILIFLILILISYIPFLKSFSINTDFAKPFRYVNSHMQKNDFVLNSDMYLYVGANYYINSRNQYGTIRTTTNSQTERVWGYRQITKEIVLNQINRLWYFEPEFFNVRNARSYQEFLKQNFHLIKKQQFAESNVNVYLFEK